MASTPYEPYTKQNFQDGEILFATQLNNIETGLKNLEIQVLELQDTVTDLADRVYALEHPEETT